MDTLADCMMYHLKTVTVENKTELNFPVCVLCDTTYSSCVPGCSAHAWQRRRSLFNAAAY